MQILQYAKGRWIVEGNKGKEYHVKRGYQLGWGPEEWWCDCPGSIYRGRCKHIEAVRIAISENKS